MYKTNDKKEQNPAFHSRCLYCLYTSGQWPEIMKIKPLLKSGNI